MRTPRSAAVVTAFATSASAVALSVAAGTADAATTTGNLVDNPSYADGKTGWAGDANTAFTVSTNGFGGTRGANLAPVSSGNVQLTDSPDSVDYTTAGATYTATVRVKNPVAGTTVRGAVSVTERVSGTNQVPLAKSTAFSLADTTWRTVTVSGVAAGNTVGAPGAHGLSLDVVGLSMSRSHRLVVDDWTLTRTNANVAPTPAFSATTSYLTAKFDASTSDDTDGSIVSYAWDFGDGTTATGRLASKTYDTAGAKTVTLTVKDDDGATRSITRTVNVVANVAPTAAFDVAKTYLTAKFDATGSIDTDGTISSYRWNFGDGTTATGRTPSKTYDAGGVKNVALTVTDNAGESTTLTKTVTVAANVAPTASFTSSETYLKAKFEATATDSDGTVSSYSWAFGDGNTGTGRTPAHTYAEAGTYPVTLTVKDNFGDTTTVRGSVTVVANVAPVLVANTSTSYLAAKFNPSGSTDSDGTITSYTWDFGDGTTERGGWVSHLYAAAGTYTVTLTATDNGGATVSTTTSVTVVANLAPVVLWNSNTRYLTANLDANGSSDSDGRIVSYDWSFGDGTAATGREVSRTFDQAGTYQV